MQDSEDRQQDKNRVGNLKIQSENIAFSGDEMIACARCGKSNPPNRASCLYCAEPIDVPKDRQQELKLNLRKLENWENGFNVVFLPPCEHTDVGSVARYFKYEPDMCEQMLASKHPFPLARIESEAEAAIAVEQLSKFGLAAAVVTDINLKIGRPNTRLRGVEFLEDTVALTAFNTGERQVLHSSEIALIVTGRIVESKTESVEKRKKKDRKVLSESASSSDDLLIDIYAADERPGWRITTKGFDFSCLGAEKSLLAADNAPKILKRLIAFAPTAKLVDEYSSLLDSLTEVWDIDRRTDFEGLKRTGVWKSGFSSVVRTSNVDQFTKYSRLQRILL